MRDTRVLLPSVIVLSAAAFILLAVVATAKARGQTTVPSLSLGTPMLPDDCLTRFELHGRQKELAQFEIVDVPDQRFKKALRITTQPGAGSEWNAQLRTIPIGSIQKGDVLLARFWMRCVESMTGEGFTGFVYEISVPDHEKAAEARLATGEQWREFFVPFRAAQDFPADQSQVCFRVGYDRQTIEIGGIEITNFGKAVKLEELPRTRISYAGRAADAQWRREALERIEQVRKGELVIRVTDGAGKPIADAAVHAKLRRHAFGFGSCVTVELLLDPSPDGQRYREIVEKYFNRAVFENDMKWPALYEGISPRLDQAMDWLLQRNILVRGHNLIWPSWKWLPRQLRQYENDATELRRITAEHVTNVVSHFRGRLAHWDVVNEPYNNHDLIDLLGGQQVMIDWFKLAREADPDCKLYLNDFGVLDGSPAGAHSKHLYQTVKFLQDGGAPIDGLGIQSHFAASLPSPAQMLRTLDHFSALGLPIELTELSLNLDDRELQADYMRDFLIAAFSHPNVNGVMLWGFWEKRHWRPQAALFNGDWSLRPHGQQWMQLVHEQWATDVQMPVDGKGIATVRGFCGEYDLIITAGGKSKTVQANLPREGCRLTIAME